MSQFLLQIFAAHSERIHRTLLWPYRLSSETNSHRSRSAGFSPPILSARSLTASSSFVAGWTRLHLLLERPLANDEPAVIERALKIGELKVSDRHWALAMRLSLSIGSWNRQIFNGNIRCEWKINYFLYVNKMLNLPFILPVYCVSYFNDSHHFCISFPFCRCSVFRSIWRRIFLLLVHLTRFPTQKFTQPLLTMTTTRGHNPRARHRIYTLRRVLPSSSSVWFTFI